MIDQVKVIRASRRYILIEMPISEAQKYLESLESFESDTMMPRWKHLTNKLREVLNNG